MKKVAKMRLTNTWSS